MFIALGKIGMVAGRQKSGKSFDRVGISCAWSWGKLGNSDSFGAAFGRLMKRKRAEMRITQGQLAAMIYPDIENAAETRKGDISKLENGKVANPNTNTISKIAKALGITDEEIDTLHKQAQMSPAEQLDNLGTLPRDTLELLASRFEIETPHALSDYDLQSVLTKKAEEYRGYRALVDGLDERVAAISNLKGAAQDAAERLDFAQVEELLSQVDKVETEIAAETKQARAANALLRGRVQQAYDLLTVAADSFASIDALEPSRRRCAYGNMLNEYNQHFAGDASHLAAQMWGEALKAVDRADDAKIWASLQVGFGNAVLIIGKREKGTERLELAVGAYEAALQVWTQDKVPLTWAMTQNNLGSALLEMGKRESGTERLKLAVKAFETALQEHRQDRVPLDWAMTQNNLGCALQELGERENGTERLELAIDSFEAALQELTQDRVPLHWAMTQNNLGNALRVLGERENNTARLELAVEAFTIALQEHTQDKVPLDWAMTQNNLGIALQELGRREYGTERMELAKEAYKSALQEWTQNVVPLKWAMTQNNLGNVLHLLGKRESSTARLELAVEAYETSLQERTQDSVPLDWAATQNNLGNALVTLGQRESGTGQLLRAVGAINSALQEWTQDVVPLKWARSQASLGNAYIALFDKDKDQAQLDKAESHTRAAIAVFKEAAPYYTGLAELQLKTIVARRK